jgi:hypothetical protein
VLIGGRLAETPTTLRTIGDLLGASSRAEALAGHAEAVLSRVQGAIAKIPPAEQPSVYVARGPTGLQTAVAGSIASEVVYLLGARNVVGKDTAPRTIVEVSPEQLLAWQPDVILTIDRRFHAAIRTDPAWQELKAVHLGRLHFVPDLPFSWLDDPPAPNRLIGLLWLGKLLYPAFSRWTCAPRRDVFMAYSTTRNRARRSSTGFSPIRRHEPPSAIGYLAIVFGTMLALLLAAVAVMRRPGRGAGRRRIAADRHPGRGRHRRDLARLLRGRGRRPASGGRPVPCARRSRILPEATATALSNP